MSGEYQCEQNFKKLNVGAQAFVSRFNAQAQSVMVPMEKTEEPNGDFMQSQVNIPKQPVKKVDLVPISAQEEFVLPSKEFVNLVFIGHVDAGKSTIGGNLLILTGNVDSREVEKNMLKAKEMNRESWYLSWALDVNEDERAKGKTVECGRASFETENKHFTLWDAPGHKSFVTHMISGSCQADVAVLVISARIGEFEAGFEKGGQTQEHAMLVKTSGVKRLIVLINKMDDPSVDWSEDRYNEIKDKLTPFLKKTGFNPKSDLHFMPCSGFKGHFLKDPADENICPFYRGPTLLEYLDSMPPIDRCIDGPLRLTVLDKVKDMGLFIIGKIESGIVKKNQKVVILPNEKSLEVTQIMKDEVEYDVAMAGDNVTLKVKNIEEEEITTGSIICSPNNLCQVTECFDAQILVGDVTSIISTGYCAVMHVHSLTKEVTITRILASLDKQNPVNVVEKYPKYMNSGDLVMVRFEVVDGSICVENFRDFPQLGRFILRKDNLTVAQGKIMKILPKKAN